MSLKYRIISAAFAVLTIFSISSCSGEINDLPPKVTIEDTTEQADTTKTPDTAENPDTPDTTVPSGENGEKEIKRVYSRSLDTLIPNPARFAFGESELLLTTYDYSGGFIELDKRYMALLTYTHYEYEDGSSKRENVCVNVLDKNTGRIMASLPIDGDLTPYKLYSVIEDGYVIYGVEYDPPGVVSRERFWTLTLKDGVFSITSSDTYTGNPRFYLCTSPDGKYLAYREYIPDENNYGIFIEDADGNVIQVAKDYPINPDFPDGWWINLKPQGFIDNDTFIYNLFSEGARGYGIYRISTKENTEYEQDLNVFSISDGLAYAGRTHYASVGSVGTIDRDGNYTEFSVPEQYHDLIFVNELDVMDMCGGRWLFAPRESKSVYVFTKDFSTMSAKIDLPSDRYLQNDFVGEGHLTLTFVQKKQTEEKDEIDDIREITSLLHMTVKEIRDKYGKTVLNSSNQHDPRKYVLQSARNFVITFDGWHSRYRNGYHLNVGGYMYPSYITLSAKNTGDIGIAHGDTIDAYAAPSDFENVYYDHRGDVYLTLNFDDCVIKICVDPGWGSSFALSTQEEKDAEFEKYKEDPYGTVKEIVFFPSDELKARLESQKKEEINGEIFALLDMTPSEITSKYGELTETYFENVRSYIMHTPDRLDGVNLVYSQSQPSENELPQEIVINEYFDRSFLGMHIGEHVTALVRGKTITRVWYDEDIGCCLSFEEDGYTVTVITGGEGCTGEIGSAEWAKSFKEKPLGYIRAIKAEKQPE